MTVLRNTLLAAILTVCWSAAGFAAKIETYTGGTGSGLAAGAVALSSPTGVAAGTGGYYIVSSSGSILRFVNTATSINTVRAGNGTAGYTDDGSVASTGTLVNAPYAVAQGPDGSIYIADTGNHRIRKISPAGVITTIAGTGTAGYNGDGFSASLASLSSPYDVKVSSSGDIYIADTSNHRIRKITASTGFISTLAGVGTQGNSGDAGMADGAQLNSPKGVLPLDNGEVYIADSGNNRVRYINTGGVINAFAGNGTAGFSPNTNTAINAAMTAPVALAYDGEYVYISETGNNAVRRVKNGAIYAFCASTSTPGFAGDNGAALTAALNAPWQIFADTNTQTLYIADSANNRIRSVNLATLVINTAAGNGTYSYSGDGASAAMAQFDRPQDIAADSEGNIYIADTYNYRLRKISAAGVVSTVFGTGSSGTATTQLGLAYGVGVSSDNAVYIADTTNYRVLRLGTGGTASIFAGTGVSGYSGDGQAANLAELMEPRRVAVGPNGTVYITDGHRIRTVSVTGIINTIAGTGIGGMSGDGTPAVNAAINGPYGIFIDTSSVVYFADTGNNRIRRISAGIINTIAGNGNAVFSGDNGLARDAGINAPRGVVRDSSGNFYIADYGNRRVRKVNTLNVISTLAGNGTAGASGDYQEGPTATLTSPSAVYADSIGTVYINDEGSSRVRRTVGRYSITGYVLYGNGPAIAGATVTLSGYISSSAVTAADGSFSFAGLEGANPYTVTPTKTGETFAPASRTYANLLTSPSAVFNSTSTVFVSDQSPKVEITGGARGYVRPDYGETAKISVYATEWGYLTASIYTLNGQLVWHRTAMTEQNTFTDFHWDCTNMSGSRVATGIYIVYVKGGGVNIKEKAACVNR